MSTDRWWGQRSTLLTIIIKPDTVWQGFIRRGEHRPFMLQKPPFGAICVFLLFPPEKQMKTDKYCVKDKKGATIFILFKAQIMSHHFHFSSGSFLAFFFPPVVSFFTSFILFFGFFSWKGQIWHEQQYKPKVKVYTVQEQEWHIPPSPHNRCRRPPVYVFSLSSRCPLLPFWVYVHTCFTDRNHYGFSKLVHMLRMMGTDVIAHTRLHPSLSWVLSHVWCCDDSHCPPPL